MELFDFQKTWSDAAIKYFNETDVKLPRFNLFLDMGLGKTYISLDICKRLNVEEIFVVCPKSLISMWEYEITKYFKFKPPKFTVINYERFIRDEIIFEPDILILDEAHRVKNVHSKTHKRITEHVRPKRILALTGTPITRDYLDLFGILIICSPTISFNGMLESQFRMRYIVNQSTERTEELVNLIKPYTIFAKLEDYIKDIPPYEDIIIPVELAEAQKVALRWIYNSDDLAVTRIIRAQHITSGINLFSGKREACESLIYDILTNNEKVVVFTKFDDEFNWFIEAYGPICTGINGKTKQKDRESAIKAFQENPDVKIFVANLQAASVGLTLTAAHKCIFYTETTTWGDMDQAKARIYRIGQTNFCTYYYLICMDSIDELIHQSNMNKTDLIEDFKNKYGGV